MALPWPPIRTINWYGFMIGHRSVPGVIYLEDRGTYEARGGATFALPHDPILGVMLATTYTRHQELQRFLGVYAHNFIETGSEEVEQWVYFLNTTYVPFSEENEGWKALLDIYQLIGTEAMGRALKAIHFLELPIQTPLPPEGQQAFVDQAPEALKEQVGALASRIG